MKRGLRPCITRALVAAFLLVPQGPAGAADVQVQARTVFDSDELLRRDLSFVTRQRFAQSLGLSATDLLSREGHGLDLVVQMRALTDFARAFDDDADDRREREAAELDLQLAYLRYRPGDRLVLTAGRQFLIGALRPVDVDGAGVGLSGTLGFSVAAATGREVRYDALTVDGAWFERAQPRWSLFEDGAPERTWITQADVAWRWHPNRYATADIKAGHRLSHRAGHLFDRETGAAMGFAYGDWDARGRFEYGHVIAATQAAAAHVSVRWGRRGTARLGWRLERPRFDLDSIFNVFPVTPHVGWRVDLSHAPSRQLRLSGFGFLRAYGLDGDAPLAGGLGGSAAERAVGGGARVAFDWRRDLSLALNTTAESGYGAVLVSGSVRVRWEPLTDRLDSELTWRHAYRDGDGQYGHITGVRGLAGYRLSGIGRLAVTAEYLADYRFKARFRLMTVVDFDLDLL